MPADPEPRAKKAPKASTSGRRPAAITSLADADSNGKRNWLIYAPSGNGKTVLAGTAPKAMFVAVEHGGTESAKMLGSTADEFVADDLKKLDEAYNYFRYGTGCQDYEWVILDSISEIEDLMWAAQQGSSTVQKIQDYGVVATKMKREVDRWNRLPINVLYTAGAMRLDTEDLETDEDKILLTPAMGTKNGVLSQKVCGKVTLVGYLSVRETPDGVVHRRLQLRGNDRVTAKDRHGIAPKTGFLNSPTIPKMIEKADASLLAGPGKSQEKTEKKAKGKKALAETEGAEA